MMKEFGSNFELSYTKGSGNGCELTNTNSQLFLRSARECLLLIGKEASQKGINTVFMPALCCSSMVQPFIQLEYHVEFYRLRPDLTIDIEYLNSILKDNSVLILMKYHGMDTYSNAQIRELISKFENVLLIQDCTQNIFTESMYDADVDYHIGSIRKWIAIPDGAFVTSANHELTEDGLVEDDTNVFTETFYKSMVEKTEYLSCGDPQIKQGFREKNAFCMQYLRGSIIPIKISSRSIKIIKEDINTRDVISRRHENYKRLFERVKDNHPEVLRFTVLQECPLCFPIYINKRDEIQRKLSQNGVYCQVLWPLPKDAINICTTSRDYAEHMLAVPCDQRYIEEDMDVIADVLCKQLSEDAK